MSTTYSSEAVSHALHASPRQLQWWDEHGLITPEHVGHRRNYSERDLIAVSVVIKFRKAGISLQKSRKMITLVYRHATEIQAKLAAGAPVYLVARLGTNQAAIVYTHAAAVVEAVAAGQVMFIEIGPELQNVRANPAGFEPRQRSPKTPRQKFLKSLTRRRRAEK